MSLVCWLLQFVAFKLVTLANLAIADTDEISLLQTDVIVRTLQQQHRHVVVVTGATGATGAEVYKLFKQLINNGEIHDLEVRGLVRDVGKARTALGCSKCDPSEGIFVGDITQPETLVAPMNGATALVILTAAIPNCENYPDCSFAEGGSPKEIDWEGAKAQLDAFVKGGAKHGRGPVVLISTGGTTDPETMKEFPNLVFYKLNFEAELMASGLPYTIIKPCGLTNDPPAKTELVVGHDDELQGVLTNIPRGDIARLVVSAVQTPSLAAGLRFDICSRDVSPQHGTPTSDDTLLELFKVARFPWDKRQPDCWK